MDRLKNKVAVITGGGAGIGRATCELFAEEGASVIVADRDEATGREVSQSIVSRGGRALSICTDVANEESVRAMAVTAEKTFGRIDILVNNAAVFVLKGIDASVEEWREILDVNVVGPALCVKHCVPIMRRGGGGAIVNLASISSVIAQPQMLTYNATKAAIANMTRCMAMDLAGDHIRVNAVGPGAVWTQIVERLTSEAGMDREAANADPEWGGAHLLKRIADPREIAFPILFLASDEASFITGSLLMADGGYTAR
ncbi:MAG: SDR family oxidoreductase [Candidatus Saccharimonas sp.]|nr:SDR family oxidoreductase [Planctomycetaceae bacterium]